MIGDAMDPLIVERRENQWTFTLNRPEKRNALSAELVEALLSGLEEAQHERIPQLVFQGAGKNLSAGFDFTDYQEHSEGDLALRFIRIEQLLQRIASLPALTIGLAHGRNFGAGVDLFAACRIRYCRPDASFLMPGLKFGLVLGTRRFRNIVGPANAASILSASRSFDATQALEMGFVQGVVEAKQFAALLQEAAQTARQIDAPTREQLYEALDSHQAADADLAALVRSAVRPGLKERIRNYLK